MIPHLLYILNIYTKIFTIDFSQLNIDDIYKCYKKEDCNWSKILDVSLNMDVADIILGDFSNTEIYDLNEFLNKNSSVRNQLLYELKCKILLKN